MKSHIVRLAAAEGELVFFRGAAPEASGRWAPQEGQTEQKRNWRESGDFIKTHPMHEKQLKLKGLNECYIRRAPAGRVFLGVSAVTNC